MPAEEEAFMETDAVETDLGINMRRRKKRILREPDFVYQTTGRRGNPTVKKKASQAQEKHRDCRLVKIELDAARALAEFSRFAHLPVQLCPSDLRWSKRRKRTPRPILRLDSRGADEMSGTPMLSSQLPAIKLERTPSLSPDVKASPSCDCRAESPRSPLPTSKGECKAFVVTKRVASHSSIEHDVSVVQKVVKVEEVESESAFMSSAANQKLRALNSHLPFSLARESPLGCWQAVSRDEGSLHSNVTEPKVKLSPSKGPQRPDSMHGKDLVVMDALSTPIVNDDKEARRLRRIQANRESARQTIRKKQLLCEELRRRSASLTSENDAMKQKRDILMQEIASLKAQNHHLKVQLDLRVSSHAGSQPSQLGSLKSWPSLSVPCSYTAFPSHVYGWPAMMMQEVYGFCQDLLVKKENKGDNKRENFQKLPCVTGFGMAQGIPANSLCTSSVKDASSSLYACMSQEGQNWTGVVCNETGLPCDADSVASDSHQTSAEESKPKLASVIQERGSINGHRPQVDCISKDPWRMHHVTPITAAQARKRRKEMTRKKRLFTKASKLLV